ncbi:MAG TPA: asparagine synthase-related protein, partial [Bacteroidales bacterium]|nr:asparagine synthase-related protein [Bacteroidales bacterium]
MIFGRVCFEAPEKSFCFLQQIKQSLSFADSIFFAFGKESFQGGVFLNSHLPESPTDVIHYNEFEQLYVVVSGQIYNCAELGQLLGLKVVPSNPELICRAFLNWGQDFVKRLNGDFVVVIYSGHQNELLVYRDHLGVQPLAWTQHNGVFYFSSDHLSLCRAIYPGDKIQVNWFLNHFLITNRLLTAHHKVNKLAPGHFIRVTGKGVEEQRFWFPEKIRQNNKLSYAQVVSDLHYLVNDAIAIRSNTRYKAGSHLSGGLDSALVAALARIHYGLQEVFPVFSYSPEVMETNDPGKDERDLIREASVYANLHPVFLAFEKSEYFGMLKDYYFNSGSIYEEAVRNRAKEHGVNLLFSGWGGDEFISKSPSGVLSDLFFGLNWKTLLKKLPFKKPKSLLKEILTGVILPAFGLQHPASYKSHKKSLRYLKMKFCQHDRREIKRAFHFRSLKQWFISVISSHYLAERCEVWYIQGLRQGIAYRFPLLDRRIAEYVMQVPAKHFVRGGVGRSIMREICRQYLPERICGWQSKADHT